jgi:hypothetical protein
MQPLETIWAAADKVREAQDKVRDVLSPVMKNPRVPKSSVRPDLFNGDMHSMVSASASQLTQLGSRHRLAAERSTFETGLAGLAVFVERGIPGS